MRFVSATDANENWRAGLMYEGSPAETDDPRGIRLEQCVDQAESIVLNYLKVTDDSPPWAPEDADLGNVKAAILIVGKSLYDEDYEAQAKIMRQDGIVPLLLARMRDPAFA